MSRSELDANLSLEPMEVRVRPGVPLRELPSRAPIVQIEGAATHFALIVAVAAAAAALAVFALRWLIA